MLNDLQYSQLSKSEKNEYDNLIGTKAQNLISLEEKKKTLASILLKIDELTAINLNLDAERAKLNKTYNDIMIERQLVKEARAKELALQVAPMAPAPSPVVDSPAVIVKPPVASVEEKKSNIGMILGVAALGVGAYLYTKE